APIRAARIARDRSLGVIRTIANVVKMRTRGAQLVLPVRVERMHIGLAIVAARNSGLVRDEKRITAGVIHPLHGGDGSGHERQVVGPEHIAGIDIDRSVAVKENCRARPQANTPYRAARTDAATGCCGDGNLRPTPSYWKP